MVFILSSPTDFLNYHMYYKTLLIKMPGTVVHLQIS